MADQTENTSFSEKLRLGKLFAVNCPSRSVIKHVSSLWGVLCLISLREGTLRFSELRKKAAGVSEKMLAQTLRRLEEDGFVSRVSYPVVPPFVEYSLTPMGQEVAALVAGLADWVELNIGEVMESRREKGVA